MFTFKHFFSLNFHCLTYSALDKSGKVESVEIEILIEVRVSGSLPRLLHQVLFLFGTHIVPTIRTGGERSVITSAASIPTQCYNNIGKCTADGRVKCF